MTIVVGYIRYIQNVRSYLNTKPKNKNKKKQKDFSKQEKMKYFVYIFV